MATRAANPPSRLQFARELFTKTFANWSEDNVPRLAAAFSFYAVLSLAPLLVLAVVAAGLFYGQGEAQTELLRQAQGAVGRQGASLLKELIENANKPGATAIATIFSLVVTFFSASNLFIQLNEAVNAIWGIKQEGSMFRNLILSRVAAFLGVVVFGLVVLGWLTLDAWLQWLHRNTGELAGAEQVSVTLWKFLSFAVTLLVLTGAFGVSFKGLPKGRVQWSDVWLPAFVTALGFAVSKLLLSYYFGFAGVATAYGSAGALVVILLWIYYTSQIYFFGVEMVYTYSHTRGSLVGKDSKAAPQYS